MSPYGDVTGPYDNSITGTYDAEIESGTRQHLAMHGLRAFPYHMGNFFGAWWFPLFFHLFLAVLFLAQVSPFKDNPGALLAPLVFAMVLVSANLTAFSQLLGALGWPGFVRIVGIVRGDSGSRGEFSVRGIAIQCLLLLQFSGSVYQA